jgi:tripartite-type tricarboxylate transporter receptor subunit TctC
MLGSSSYVLAIHPGVSANNVKELIALARAKPGQLTYGSAGTASLGHLAGELFSAEARVKFNHVPYKSSALAVLDVLSGRVDLQFGTIAPTLPHIRSGKLRALATTGAARLAALPEVPTVAEAALPGFEVSLWMGVLAPAATRAAIITRLNREITAILVTAEMTDALVAQGIEPAPSTPAAFGARIRDEIAKWQKVVKIAKLSG